MAETNAEIIENAVGAILVPDMDVNLASLGVPVKVELSAGTATISLRLGFPADGIVQALGDEVRETILQMPGVDEAKIQVDWEIRAHAVQGMLAPLPGARGEKYRRGRVGQGWCRQVDDGCEPGAGPGR